MQDIIAAKRDGRALTEAQIRHWIAGCVDGSIPDYQSSALLMAIVLKGMGADETAWLTAAMADSGDRIDPGSLPGGLDKHSTGGVGDKATLVVVPLVAAAGIPVCKMSGRGLGHTGGTFDKLSAIPGYVCERTPEEMVAQVQAIGACLCSQSERLAPADARLYALRDVTGTVESIPLIVASILSKKLAGGAGVFVFDVKAGGGALMPTVDAARELAHALVDASRAAGRRAVATVTDMDQPLGRMIGNALEVREAIELMDPRTASNADPRLRELCLELAADAVAEMRGVGVDDARREVEGLLSDGSALRVFRRIVDAQGGDVRVVDDPGLLPRAPLVLPVTAGAGGFVAAIDARAVGAAVVDLGGGRARKEDIIDPAVGVEILAPVGAQVQAGETVALVHAPDVARGEQAVARVGLAFVFAAEAPQARPVVIEQIG